MSIDFFSHFLLPANPSTSQRSGPMFHRPPKSTWSTMYWSPWYVEPTFQFLKYFSQDKTVAFYCEKTSPVCSSSFYLILIDLILHAHRSSVRNLEWQKTGVPNLESKFFFPPGTHDPAGVQLSLFIAFQTHIYSRRASHFSEILTQRNIVTLSRHSFVYVCMFNAVISSDWHYEPDLVFYLGLSTHHYEKH